MPAFDITTFGPEYTLSEITHNDETLFKWHFERVNLTDHDHMLEEVGVVNCKDLFENLYEEAQAKRLLEALGENGNTYLCPNITSYELMTTSISLHFDIRKQDGLNIT